MTALCSEHDRRSAGIAVQRRGRFHGLSGIGVRVRFGRRDRVLPAIRAIRQVTDKPIIVYRTTVTSTIRKPKPGRLIPPVPNRPSPIWYRNGSTREPDSLEDAAERLQTISEP